MLKSINGSAWISVSNSSYNTYPYIDMNKPLAGQVRYNGVPQCFEIYDGSSWQQVSYTPPTIDLALQATELLNWVATKKKEEEWLKSLSAKHPAIKAAAENVRIAEEQLKATIILSQDEQTTS
jgi:hypothetical protein